MYKELFELKGKTSLITGATSDIGNEIAFALAEFGSDLILVDIANKEEELSKLQDLITKKGGKAKIYTFNIASLSEIKKFIEEISCLKTIDILINNAGINITNLALNASEDEWDRIMDINLKGLFFLTREISKIMVKNNYGKIISIASQVAILAFPKRSIYAASKSGLIGLSRILARELAEYNINVNCIAPTLTNTKMAKPVIEDKKLFKEVRSRIPTGRINEPIDLIGAIIYLASRASAMVTGQTLIVDGGWTSSAL